MRLLDFIGCGYRTVAYWCVHGDPDNFDSLRDKRQQGNYRKATEEYIALLQEVVEKPQVSLVMNLADGQLTAYQLFY